MRIRRCVCAVCGKSFSSRSSGKKYCSEDCKEQGMKHKDREPVTALTPYLAQKYLREGYCPREIAEILNRSERTIRTVLQEKLPKEAYERMEIYRCMRKRRPNTGR